MAQLPVVHLDGKEVYGLAVDLSKLPARAQIASVRVVRHYGLIGRTTVQANASGRPGPRAVTGDYRRSITVVFTTIAGNPAAVIGTNKPQGRRLEFGFVGVDALGRHYDQPPYPHFGPMIEAVTEPFARALGVAAVGP